MDRLPFIFSDEKRYRVARHLAFWLSWWLFQGFLYSFVAIKVSLVYVDRLVLSLTESLIYLTAHAFLTYTLLYWVIPRYLMRSRYGKAIAATIFLALLTAALAALQSLTVITWIRMMYLPPEMLDKVDLTIIALYSSLMAGLRGALTIAGMASAIKLMKLLYVREQRNLQLQKENAEAQLQLLKAQVHPHFLFNTLNNIFAHTQNTAPLAADLLTRLSGILRFMLYESRQSQVPLAMEFQLLRDYVKLEEVRYSNRLDLQVVFPADDGALTIAPMLLLPLVENAFKHGASNMLDQPWVSMEATITGRRISFKLVNGKQPGARIDSARSPDSGIGVANVQQRLQLLYPDRHELVITEEDEVFIVNLRIELDGAIRPPVRQTLLKPSYEPIPDL